MTMPSNLDPLRARLVVSVVVEREPAPYFDPALCGGPGVVLSSEPLPPKHTPAPDLADAWYEAPDGSLWQAVLLDERTGLYLAPSLLDGNVVWVGGKGPSTVTPLPRITYDAEWREKVAMREGLVLGRNCDSTFAPPNNTNARVGACVSTCHWNNGKAAPCRAALTPAEWLAACKEVAGAKVDAAPVAPVPTEPVYDAAWRRSECERLGWKIYRYHPASLATTYFWSADGESNQIAVWPNDGTMSLGAKTEGWVAATRADWTAFLTAHAKPSEPDLAAQLAAVTGERDAALAKLDAIRWAMGGGDATPARD